MYVCMCRYIHMKKLLAMMVIMVMIYLVDFRILVS